MFAFAVSAFFLLLFGAGVLRDRRRFANAVHLGLAVTFLGLGLLAAVEDLPSGLVESLLVLILLVLGLGPVVLAVLLCVNGVKMVRREGRRPANLLSLLAGLGILGTFGLTAVAVLTRSRVLGVVAVTLLLVLGYVSFLFVCFVGYAFLYGRMRLRRDAGFVVVLGSGLIGGRRVPPLLASRLDRGREVYERLAARGTDVPLLVTSGGQGPDEELPESHAMADYLVERGFPEDRIRREDRSRSTEENLRFSKELMDAERPGAGCVVVTNDFHAFRAALMARKAGVDGQVVGSPTAAYYWPSATIREFAAVFLEYRVVNLTVCAGLVALGCLGLAVTG
ncbi:YdcF family protein [Streptomyces termitum]|uniref:Membrane protein n=1 Tax=Streptomyces termitum TaxID=67368 RepID=A0A918WBP6_9ACTN|nr:YdcF family protein [Streptomyces termitum]GHA97001.1 membrane protein [Streptomyces termitum]